MRTLSFSIAILVSLLLPSGVLANSPLAERCQDLGQNGNYQQARDLVDKYISEYPNDNDALFCRAGAKNELGDLQGSLADLKLAYRIDESRVDILRGMILVYQKLGNKTAMCKVWSTLKVRNITAPRDLRYDLNSNFGREINSQC